MNAAEAGWQLSPFALPGAFAAAMAVALFVLVWDRRRAPGATSFLLLLVTVGIWSALEAAIVCAPGLELKLLLTKFQYLGIATAPVFWFFFAVGYCGQSQRLRGWRGAFYWIVPAATLALMWTNEGHGWFYEQARLLPQAGWDALVLTYGPAFIVYSLYSYALIFASTVIFLWQFGDSPAFRARRWAVVAAPAITIVGNALYLAKVVPAMPVDLTPLGFALALSVLAFLLLRHRFFDAVPVARDAVLDGMPEPVLLIDDADEVIEANRAARALLAVREGTVVGAPLVRLEPALDARLLRAAAAGDPVELERRDDSGARTFDVVVSPVESHGGSVRGRVVVLRDVTDRKLVEQELVAARERLERANAELHDLASTDLLTRLANRGHFLERLRGELKAAQRRGEPLSLLLFDLDGFKAVNDTFGHPAGDILLAAVGETLAAVSRASDLPARLGGEEFAVLLPATDAAGAALVAEKVRVAIAELRVPDEEGREMRLTMSGGLVTAPPGRFSSNDVLRIADRALYAAKRGGKNLVSSAESTVRTAAPLVADLPSA